MVIVCSNTQAAIEAAKCNAGENGTVEFPSGVIEVDGLTADVFGQKWIFRNDSILKRSDSSDGPVIKIPSDGSLEIIGGTFDGNKDNISVPTGVIEACDGSTLKMSGGFKVINAPLVGIWGRDGIWHIRDGEIRDTKYWGIYWAAISMNGSDRRKAPKIHGVTIDRSINAIASGMGGGICINGGPTTIIKEIQNADISDNTIILPPCSTVALRNTAYDAVAIEVNYCYMPILTRNRIFGGRIGVSTQTCPWAIQSLNQGNSIGDYMIEMVNCEFGSATGNMATGQGVSIAHYGISISGSLSKGLNITGNNCKMLFSSPINCPPNASGGSYPHTISANN